MFEQLVKDPVNTLIALLVFGVIVLFLRYALPWLRKGTAQFLGEKNFSLLYGLVIQAAQAAEQARRKGELDKLLGGLGIALPVELSDDDKCREYVLAFVQRQLARFSWGHLIDVQTIYTLLLSALRQDAHKGATSPLDDIAAASPEQLAQVFSAEQLEAISNAKARIGIAKGGMVLANGPLPQPRGRGKH